ncbi:MAG: Gfo/Idh/MocA family oxidoreductase [Caldilineaceae bacterium]|nr:Gfo/Idh/MocA family oxidoreductase [Caldilineaceae bacterium]
MTTEPRLLKAAIVGLRNHAGTLEPDKNHGLIKSFKAQPTVSVVAYCEWAPEQATALAALQQADPQAAIYTNLTDLLAQASFDLAVILLPPNEAITAALHLAAAGKHLFVEKQVARYASEIAPLRTLAAEQGLVIGIGYPWPAHPVAQALKSYLAEGVLGDLLAMEARLVTTQVRPGLRDPDHWMYRSDSEGGGILHMEGGHWLTLFQYFSGARVKAVTALCTEITPHLEAGLEDVATVALEFTNGVHAVLHMGYLLAGAGPRNDLYFALRGSLGAATWPLTGEFTVASTAPAWQSEPVRHQQLPLPARPVYADQWGYDFVAAFIDAIQQGGQPVVGLEAGYHVLQIIDAAYESSRSGQRIMITI